MQFLIRWIAAHHFFGLCCTALNLEECGFQILVCKTKLYNSARKMFAYKKVKIMALFCGWEKGHGDLLVTLRD